MNQRNCYLDNSLEGFFKKWVVINGFLEKNNNLFLRVYEGDKFHYLIKIKKSVHGKNKVLRDLSSCVMQNFNGYEIMKNVLQYKEKKAF